MALPEPEPGLVIRYDYVWSHEAAKGRIHSKDRPACLVAASDPGAAPRFVVILPITHREPSGTSVGIEIPSRVRTALGLDAERCWVIVSEYNVDEWPNSGVSPVSGYPGVFSYGFLPPLLFQQIKAGFLNERQQGRAKGVRR